MTDKNECGYFDTICIFCGILSKNETICINGHLNVDLNDLLKYNKDYNKYIKKNISGSTGIISDYVSPSTYRLIIKEYNKCLSKLQYVELDYNHTNPFLVGTVVNTILGEDKPRQLIYPFHNVIKDINSTSTTINEEHLNKNVELFVKSFQILECLNDIADPNFNYKHLIDKLVIKPDGTKYSYRINDGRVEINADFKTKLCIDNSLNDFMSKLKLDIKEKNCDWLIYSIGLKDPNDETGHANILIVNMLNSNDIKMFYFEPHGFSEENLGYKVCFNAVKNVVTSLATEYNKKKRTITLGPETFNNKEWQTNEPFCASWCVFFMSIVLLNPNLSMVNIYELFKIEQPEIRFLLLYRFLFWYCNSTNYEKTNIPPEFAGFEKIYYKHLSKFNNAAANFISKNEKLDDLLPKFHPVAQPWSAYDEEISDAEVVYYCNTFMILGDQYENNKLFILKYCFKSQNYLRSLDFYECAFIGSDFSKLSKWEIKKLSLRKCSYSSDIFNLSIPESVVKIELMNNNFSDIIIIEQLPKTIEYIYTDSTDYNDIEYIVLLSGLNNIILNTSCVIPDDKKQEFDIAQKEKNITIINTDSFYKIKGERHNWCFKCKRNDNIDFDNEIEQMECFKCAKNLPNENRTKID
jgi:hypothetical protein